MHELKPGAFKLRVWVSWIQLVQPHHVVPDDDTTQLRALDHLPARPVVEPEAVLPNRHPVMEHTPLRSGTSCV